MSHPRVRFTVRRLMLAIAVAAALVAAFEAGRRWGRAERAAWSRPVYLTIKKGRPVILETIGLPGGTTVINKP
jgi:hypothetical protein